jgi:hypothetical protein
MSMRITLTMAANKDSVTVGLPIGWYRAALDTDALYDFAEIMPWTLHGGAYNDVNKITVSAVAADDSQEYVGEIEIWRQSERTLLERYDFVQQYGYVLIGRCSFELSDPGTTTYDTSTMAELTANEEASIRTLFPGIVKAQATENQSPSVALANAIAVHDALAPYLANNGPSSVWSGSHTPSECFDLVMNHNAPVMCGMAQLLYAYLAISTRNFTAVDVRKTTLSRYGTIAGIVPNTHAVISLDSSAGWFMFDPFAGVYCTVDEVAVSPDEIRARREASDLDSVTVHKRDASSWQPDFGHDPYDYNYFCHFNYITQSDLTDTGGEGSTQIDVGPGATALPYAYTTGYTIICHDNPANAAGTVTEVEVWVYANATGVKIGMFYQSGTPGQWTCRSHVTLGNVASGAKRTFSGLSLPCQVGDCIGLYLAAGTIRYDAGGSWRTKQGDHTADGQQDYGSVSNAKAALYGVGAS